MVSVVNSLGYIRSVEDISNSVTNASGVRVLPSLNTVGALSYDINTGGGYVLSAVQALKGYARTTVGAGNLELPTGTALVASIPNCVNGTVIELIVDPGFNTTITTPDATMILVGTPMIPAGLPGILKIVVTDTTVGAVRCRALILQST